MVLGVLAQPRMVGLIEQRQTELGEVDYIELEPSVPRRAVDEPPRNRQPDPAGPGACDDDHQPWHWSLRNAPDRGLANRTVAAQASRPSFPSLEMIVQCPSSRARASAPRLPRMIVTRKRRIPAAIARVRRARTSSRPTPCRCHAVGHRDREVGQVERLEADVLDEADRRARPRRECDQRLVMPVIDAGQPVESRWSRSSCRSVGSAGSESDRRAGAARTRPRRDRPASARGSRSLPSQARPRRQEQRAGRHAGAPRTRAATSAGNDA